MLDHEERERLVLPYEPRAPVGGYLFFAALCLVVAAGTVLTNSLWDFSADVERTLLITSLVAGPLVVITLTVAFVITYRFQEEMEPATDVDPAPSEPPEDVRLPGRPAHRAV